MAFVFACGAKTFFCTFILHGSISKSVCIRKIPPKESNMTDNKKLFTSESVTEGHPDKMCDRISDAVLDAILAKDPMARVGCETAASTGLIVVMGEITTNCYVDIPAIVRRTVTDIGYDRAKYGFDGATCGIITSIHDQSADIALGVNSSREHRISGDKYDLNGASDQGLMFGYACDETQVLMPAAIYYAHLLARRLAEVRKNGELPYLRPDGKSQVTIEYADGIPVRTDTIVLSAQHAPEITHEQIEKDLIKHVIKKVIPENLLENTRYLINPTGRFVTGGPMGDSGLTGRKIIVDTYGGYCVHGGGAFSGKDPTKVDRSAAYMARYICKNLVAAGICRRVRLELSYAIGIANPVSMGVCDFGTSRFTQSELIDIVNSCFDLRPAAIIDRLDLRRPIYEKTSAYGHFGQKGFPWEETNAVNDVLKAAAEIR